MSEPFAPITLPPLEAVAVAARHAADAAVDNARQKRGKRRKRRSTISGEEALRRLERMVIQIEKDVRMALLAEAAFGAANDIVGKNAGPHLPGAETYNTVVVSLALNLAICLSRLFDEGSRSWPPNKREVASIPLMIRLLKQRRCQKVLLERAAQWTPNLPAQMQTTSCREAIDKCITGYSVLRTTPSSASMMSRLRKFRNKRMAHSMVSEFLSSPPCYNDLFSLADAARDITKHAKLAVAGKYPDLDQFERYYRRRADVFWSINFKFGGSHP